jgi:hypothetical protein
MIPAESVSVVSGVITLAELNSQEGMLINGMKTIVSDVSAGAFKLLWRKIFTIILKI